MTDIIYQGAGARIVANSINLNAKDATIMNVTTNTGYVMTGAMIQYAPTTVSRSIVIQESSKVFSNEGAGAAIELTLPAATYPGINFKFVRVASFALRVVPPASSAIKYSGGTMADAEYLELASDGAKLHLISDSSGDWIATYEFGTLTEQTP